jgi:glycerate 2-kinase
LINPRQQLFAIYQATLESVQGVACTRHALRQQNIEGPVAIVAIGKAAASMMEGAITELDDQVQDVLIITKKGHCFSGDSITRKFRCIEAGHPVPDQRSLDAGQDLMSFLDQQPHNVTLLFLISGGSSALVELLPSAISLADWQRVNEWLLASGLDIEQMNRVRIAMSSIKGGRLAKHLEDRKVINLMISDVPGDRPYIIGSGLLSPWPKSMRSLPRLPSWIEQLLEGQQPLPAESDKCFEFVETQVIATNRDAVHAAGQAARKAGYQVKIHEKLIQGDAATTGRELARQLQNAKPGIYIWGGETTVKLPPNPGIGGRNQHLALAAAMELRGNDHCWLLAAGTDGTDGPTDYAGALVDGRTVEKGMAAGLTPEEALASADAGRFLATSHDLIETGPTGTNVMDLIIGLNTG